MKVLMINSVCGIRSTGRICTDIAEELEKQGNEVKIAYGREEYVPEEHRKYAIRIGNKWDVRIHALMTRLTDRTGFYSVKATKKFLEWADEYNPDLLWLHNIHGYYINIELLFNWIKSRPYMQVKWTLHDCWAFTGHCTHFSFIECDKWKTKCCGCQQINRYPKSFVDNSKNNFIRKKQLFTGISKIQIIVPSFWLKNLVKSSFMNEYQIEVKHNEVDKKIFKPTPSSFREKYGIDNDKIIVLGVASNWNDRKGLYDFIDLSKILDERFVVVIVGLNREQLANVPKNIIGIGKIYDQTELAKIYSASSVFVNPSVEETFGLTTVEASYCGIPVIVYENTACEELSNSIDCYVSKRGYHNIYKILNELFGETT